MALANDLYNYRRLAKPILATHRDRPLANPGQFQLPQLPVNLRELEPERIKPAIPPTGRRRPRSLFHPPSRSLTKLTLTTQPSN